MDDHGHVPQAQENCATADLERVKLQLEVGKLRVEWLLKILGLAYLVSISLGALLMFLYFVRHDFSAGGISGSDTMFLTLLPFGFLCVLVVGIFFGTVSVFPIVRVGHMAGLRAVALYHRWKKKEVEDFPIQFTWDKGNGLLLFAGTLCLAVFALAAFYAPSRVRLILLALLLLGVFPSMLAFGTASRRFSLWPRKEFTESVDRWINAMQPQTRQLVLTSFMTFVVVCLFFAPAQDIAFSLVGIRKNNVNVRLTADDFKLVAGRAMRAGIPVNPCEPITQDDFVLRHADVLWSKVGIQALVRYPSVPVGETQKFGSVRSEPLASSIAVVEEPDLPRKCYEFTYRSLFRDGAEDILSPSGVLQVDRALEWLGIGWRVQIDAMYAEEAAGARTRQMELLKAHLVNQFGVSPQNVIIKLTENPSEKWQCAKIPANLQRECKSANARIEIIATPEA